MSIDWALDNMQDIGASAPKDSTIRDLGESVYLPRAPSSDIKGSKVLSEHLGFPISLSFYFFSPKIINA